MGVDNKMLYYLLPVLFRYSTASPSGDCAGIIEDWTSWMDGANWDIKADNVESTNWNIIIEFDKPLRGFQVSNGHMKQVNMTKFEITPEKYLRQHRNAIVFNFLIKYVENSPEPEMQYIKINGETHGCLGESRKLDSYGTMKTQIGRQRAGSVNSVIFSVNSVICQFCYGGQPCSGPADEYEPRPVDGQWSAWSPYGSCVENTGLRTRSRSCNMPGPLNGGAQCVGQDKITAECDVCESIAYNMLTDESRSVDYVTDSKKCDRLDNSRRSPDWQGPGWYRFANYGRMPEIKPGASRCNTDAPGWIDGTHPTDIGVEKNIKICFHVFGHGCYHSYYTSAINCGNYYVYHLKRAIYCTLRYCSEAGDRSQRSLSNDMSVDEEGKKGNQGKNTNGEEKATRLSAEDQTGNGTVFTDGTW